MLYSGDRLSLLIDSSGDGMARMIYNGSDGEEEALIKAVL